ncbi:MAG: hypothetical protein EAZ07_03455 [Cytophagales bacterium]|nr:MAG: hypothetical protein EAZ07_03455 [Cytophagales bacterium]
MQKKIIFLLVIASILNHNLFSQAVPSSEENIPYLVTFGNNSKTSWGDDDFAQTFFFIIPKDMKKPIFLRVFDPETGGTIDEIKELPDTKTTISIYGGQGAYTHLDAQKEQPIGNFKSGIELAKKTFSNQPEYNEQWYTFGPFNPTEGELVNELGGYVIKVIIQGISGNDGNLYKLFLSQEQNSNIKVEGANSLTYEYTFRLNDKPGSISHIYPFINEDVVSIKIHTFDYDNDGIARIISVDKRYEPVQVSGDNEWMASLHKISDKEHRTSLDIQMIKTNPINDNNIVFYITNQYDKLLPFYTSPLGGAPKYKPTIGVKPGLKSTQQK